MNIGVNFFGPKIKLYKDFDGTLQCLKNIGINSAEICVAFTGAGEPPKELNLQIPPEVLKQMKGGIWDFEDASARLQQVRAAGLTVVSCHVMMGSPEPELLSGLTQRLCAFASENDIKYYVISLMQGLEGMKAYREVLENLSAELKAVGVTLCYHNHDAECIYENCSKDSMTALDYILTECPDLKLELDVGWAKYAGADPIKLMKQYKDRIALLHFKDIRADASPENRDTCFTAVGEGSIPLKDILSEASNCPALDEYGLIIDQDDSITDILDDLAIGAENIRKNV